MYDIDIIMRQLSWHSSLAEQSIGIKHGKRVECLKAFFQPVNEKYSKDVWENCAKVICSHSDEHLMPYILDLLLWLEDLNWPGAEIVLERLQRFSDVNLLAMHVERFSIALLALGENTWLQNLCELLQNEALKMRLDKNTITRLHSCHQQLD